MFNSIKEALYDLKNGKIIIICDDEGRENEGDFVALADYVTPQMVNFMITHGKGLLCCPISYENAKRLNINLMVNDNEDKLGTAFTHSIDHISCTTGISAIERSITIKALADPNATTYHFRKPGHIFPLIAKDNGVLEREGHTEATIDLAKISGCNQVGLICEIIDEDGAMARLNKLQQIAKQFDLKMIHIKDLITYRKEQEKVIKENKK